MISEEIARGVYLHIHETKKFKTQVLSITFLWPMNTSIRAESFLLSYLLSDTTEHFPKKQDLLSHLDHLYGASLNVSGVPRGACDRLKISLAGVHVNGLNDDLVEQLAGVAAECIFHPRLENGVFPDAMFRECQEQAIVSVRMIKDDPQTRCAEAAARVYGGSMANRVLPSSRQIAALTPERCAAAWEWIRSHARVDIQVLSDLPTAEVRRFCTALFPFRERTADPKLRCYVPGKEERVESVRNISQSHIVLLFESGILMGDPEYPAYALANGIFGGLPSSLLFQNVREKQGLCYSIESGLLRYDGVMRVSTAVDAPHIEEAIQSILAQVEVMKKGEFSEEDLSIARHMYINTHRTMLDDPDAILSEQYRRALVSGALDITSMITLFSRMDRESVIRAFAPLKLKTVSIVRQKG